MRSSMRTFASPAYDDSMAEIAHPGLTRPRPEGAPGRRVRWSLWLGLGALCGLAFGFAIGLAKPRFRN